MLSRKTNDNNEPLKTTINKFHPEFAQIKTNMIGVVSTSVGGKNAKYASRNEIARESGS